MGAARLTISQDQFNLLWNGIQATNSLVAELKGQVAAYAAGLENERQARETLAREVDKLDGIIRGDGTPGKPGLVEQIGDVRKVAADAKEEIKQIRNAIWIIGSPIAVAIFIDIVLRLLPLLY